MLRKVGTDFHSSNFGLLSLFLNSATEAARLPLSCLFLLRCVQGGHGRQRPSKTAKRPQSHACIAAASIGHSSATRCLQDDYRHSRLSYKQGSWLSRSHRFDSTLGWNMQMPAPHRYEPQHERRSSRTPSTFTHSRAVSTTFHPLFRIVVGHCGILGHASIKQHSDKEAATASTLDTAPIPANWRKPFQYPIDSRHQYRILSSTPICKIAIWTYSTCLCSLRVTQAVPLVLGHFQMTHNCRILPLPAV